MAMYQVCKIDVGENGTTTTSEYKDQTYYFCTADCERVFDEDSEQSLRQQPVM
jgi:YHS domain-containing protein